MKNKNIKDDEIQYNNDYFSLSVSESFDILRFIDQVCPKIENSKEKIVIEKFLLGYTSKEICEISEYKSTSSVYKIISKYKSMLEDELSDYIALRDMFGEFKIDYREPENSNAVEKEVNKARLILEHLFHLETYIYPFDIGTDSYKITLKHPTLGTHKFTKAGFLRFYKKVTKSLTDL